MNIIGKNSLLSFYWINDNRKIYKLLRDGITVDELNLGGHAPFLEINDILKDTMETIIGRVLLWEENNECRGVVCMKHEANVCTPPFVVSISVGGSDSVQLGELDKKSQIAGVGLGTITGVRDVISLQIQSSRVQRHVIMQYSSIKTTFPKFALPST